MYNFVRGIADEIYIDSISIEVNGIGYLISISRRNIAQITAGSEYKIYTTLIHREDTMKLIGFITKDERELFNLLNSVSGVGAKTALAILSQFSVTEIISTIYGNDPKKLAKAPGIGLKTAQRMILELKEKIMAFKPEFHDSSEIQVSSDKIEQFEETEGALYALGYSNSEVASVLTWLNETKSDLLKSDDMIREALMWLSNG